MHHGSFVVIRKERDWSNAEEYHAAICRGSLERKKVVKMLSAPGKVTGWANYFREVSKGSFTDVPMSVV